VNDREDSYYDESMRFYTKTTGFREAFTLKDKDRKPALAYLQLNRDSFLKLAPATAERPAGLSKVDDPRTGATKTSRNAMDAWRP
jgi:hypothetical protein